jgi:hypothetical protein
MNKQTKKQIELLKKYGVSNYAIEGDRIIINGSLYLNSLQSADKDFLRGATINGNLYLDSLQFAERDFLRRTKIKGYLSLPGHKFDGLDYIHEYNK